MNDTTRGQIQNLLHTEAPPELGPGPRQGVRSLAELEAELRSALSNTQLTAHRRDLIRALVLLWHDHLDASHTISQGIENADGSLLHAIMHRREPDYWNSKYWWRRVGQHPCFSEMGKRVAAWLEAKRELKLREQLAPRGVWDAFAFVDACEAAASGDRASRQVELLRAVQRIESEVALEYFLRAA